MVKMFVAQCQVRGVYSNRLLELYLFVTSFPLQSPFLKRYRQESTRVLNSRHTTHSLPRSDFDFERCSGTASSRSYHPWSPIRARTPPLRVTIENSTACRGKEQASSDRMSFIDTSLPELPLFVQLDINSTSPLRSWESTREALSGL